MTAKPLKIAQSTQLKLLNDNKPDRIFDEFTAEKKRHKHSKQTKHREKSMDSAMHLRTVRTSQNAFAALISFICLYCLFSQRAAFYAYFNDSSDTASECVAIEKCVCAIWCFNDTETCR